ncbi:MAG: nucleotide exchange factor GrpE [Lachnospiraceae bacterium]|nr:nucleotide exchange factor GrpE [Lachnospiraceae bacterium]
MAENFDTEELKEAEEGVSIPIEGEEETREAKGENVEEKDGQAEASEETEDESEKPQAEAAGETGEEADESAPDTDHQEEKKSFFKKKKDKRDEQIAELTDRVKRQMAEFENFRKRSDKEKSQMYDMGAKSIIEKILPVVDNFERGLSGLEEGTEDPFADGMKMVYKQMMTCLEEAGVKPIEAVGAEFDPEYHNAVMHVDDEAYGENEIVEELQKGYLYHDTVVRFSMVKVAN